jgi:hypothetical protein
MCADAPDIIAFRWSGLMTFIDKPPETLSRLPHVESVGSSLPKETSCSRARMRGNSEYSGGLKDCCSMSKIAVSPLIGICLPSVVRLPLQISVTGLHAPSPSHKAVLPIPLSAFAAPR